MKISKTEQTELVENLPLSKLPTLQISENFAFSLLLEKVKIFYFFLNPMTRIKLFVHR